MVKILVLSTNGIMNDGITSWMKQTFSVMNQKGFELFTTAFDDCDSEVVEEIKKIGFSVHFVPNRKREIKQYIKDIRLFLRQEQFDIIHVCCNSAIAVFELFEAKHAGIKMRIAHSRNTMCQHRIADKVLRPFFYHYATDFYACGYDAGKWLFGKHNFTIIPNGKDLEKYSFSDSMRKQKRIELGYSDNDVVIGHVGRFNDQKNHKKLIEIFNELHKQSDIYKLCLIGDGELVENAKRYVTDLNLDSYVFFLGRRTDVPELLNAMDCMVFPSLYEGFPNVVLEWQLNGLPVVMSDVITDECAITSLVQQVSLSSDASSWSNVIERKILSRHNRLVDSVQAQKDARLKGYDIRDNAAMLRDLYLQGVAR